MIHGRRARALLGRLAAGDTEVSKVTWPRSATRGLVAVASSSRAEEIRFAATYALLSLQDRRSLVPLLALARDRNVPPSVRGMTLEVVGNLLRPSNALTSRRAQKARRVIADCLDDDSAEVRYEAVYAVKLGNIRSCKPQLERLTGDGAYGRFPETVAGEAKDTLDFFATGKWPDHDPGSPRG